jgi:hypothetical protein
MSLLVRVNLVFLALAVCLGGFASYGCRAILQANAQRELLGESGMLGTALSSAPAMAARTPAPPASGAATPLAAPEFSAAQLRELERRLARHLGPIAKLLVARAAARATGFEDLRRLLAAELESDQQRSEFLKPPPH